MPARLWKRVLAYLIDVLLLSLIVFTPLFRPLENEFTSGNMLDLFTTFFDHGRTLFLVSIIAGFLVILYWSLLEYFCGQSVGKLFLGLRVEGIRRRQISFAQAVIRNIPKISTVVLALDTLYLLIVRKGQRYFDVLSGTRVMEGENHAQSV